MGRLLPLVLGLVYHRAMSEDRLLERRIQEMENRLEVRIQEMGDRLEAQILALRQEMKAEIGSAFNRVMLYLTAVGVVLALLSVFFR